MEEPREEGAAMGKAGLPALPARAVDSHKGNFGHVLVVGGQPGMAGAPALAGLAALRSGAGLVTVACPQTVAGIVAGFEPSYMTLPLPVDDTGRLSAEAAAKIHRHPATVVALGPGLGQSTEIAELVAKLVAGLSVPLVIDADALHALENTPGILELREPGSTVLLPHPGEFGRLLGISVAAVQAKRVELAREFAQKHRVVLALKGAGTIITDGEAVVQNTTGNPGMATGGTGDVLAGMVAAVLAQGLGGFDAARLACHVHGLAGDLAAANFGQVSMMASDLLNFLPQAWQAQAKT